MTRERDLEDHFEKYGRLLRVNIRRNYAFVQYETVEEATEALKHTDGINFMGRPLTVEYCINDEKKARRSPPPYRRPSPPRFKYVRTTQVIRCGTAVQTGLRLVALPSIEDIDRDLDPERDHQAPFVAVVAGRFLRNPDTEAHLAD